jgi:hypothetical protein
VRLRGSASLGLRPHNRRKAPVSHHHGNRSSLLLRHGRSVLSESGSTRMRTWSNTRRSTPGQVLTVGEEVLFDEGIEPRLQALQHQDIPGSEHVAVVVPG